MGRRYKDSDWLLHYWGDYVRRAEGLLRILGHPGRTAENKLTGSPGKGNTPDFTPQYWPDKLAAEIEVVILKLEPMEQIALREFYIYQMSVQRIGEAHSCTISSAERLIDRACKNFGYRYR